MFKKKSIDQIFMNIYDEPLFQNVCLDDLKDSSSKVHLFKRTLKPESEYGYVINLDNQKIYFDNNGIIIDSDYFLKGRKHIRENMKEYNKAVRLVDNHNDYIHSNF
jgi:hypothetical protein